MEHVGNSKNLQDAVIHAARLEVCGGLPQAGHSSSPVVNVEQHQVLKSAQINHFAVDFHRNIVFDQYTSIRNKEVVGTHLSVDELVAERRNEELRVLFTDLMEIVADLSIQADAKIVVYRVDLLALSVLADLWVRDC